MSDPNEEAPTNKPLARRALLRGAVLLGVVGWLGAAGCSTTTIPETTMPEQATPSPSASGTAARILLAYFSRAGENYYFGGRAGSGGRQHRGARGDDRRADRLRRAPHRGRGPVSGQL